MDEFDYHLNYGWTNLHLDETPKKQYHIWLVLALFAW
jgi:hypothetical protein